MLPTLKLNNKYITDSKDGVIIKYQDRDIIHLDNIEINNLYKWLHERRKILDGFVFAKILPTPRSEFIHTIKDELVLVSEHTSKIIGKNTDYNIRKLLFDLKSRNLPCDDVVEIIIKYGEVGLTLY